MGIIEHLMQEHEQIREILNSFRQEIEALANQGPPSSAEVEKLAKLFTELRLLVREIHHAKEEALLFPSLGKNPRIREGGPRCSFFSKYVMEETHVSDLFKTLKASGMTPEAHPRSPFVQEMFTRNTPLTVPLGEHESGHLALQYLQFRIDQARTGVAVDFKALLQFYESYFDFMDLHIRKENECLFVLARDLLTEDEQINLEEKAKELEAHLTSTLR